MNQPRFAPGVVARRPRARAVRALVVSALVVAAGAVHAAPLTPEQTVDLYLGMFVNGDASKAAQYNDAVRSQYDGKDPIDTDAIAHLGDGMKKEMADGMLSRMPPKTRAALRAPVDAMVTSYLRALQRTQCKSTGSTQAPNEYIEGQQIATVAFECRVADVEPGAKALQAQLGGRKPKGDKAMIATFTAIYSGMTRIFDDAPMNRTVSSKFDVYGTNGKGWFNGRPGEVLSPVIDALVDPIPVPGDAK
ncbi:hypothetical protein VL15_33990 [Burkholderia cepacia]|uniref:DUF2059 domain-containing protein n=1 Tax=Burkholderia cepacia TaxID=292 RepID=A0A0J5WG56_BURCE|nr:hypothetical protein [Burkholderia cepacia]KML47006.1 hypothetical protein VL15_33990 [Burkholderia cepacia]